MNTRNTSSHYVTQAPTFPPWVGRKPNNSVTGRIIWLVPQLESLSSWPLGRHPMLVPMPSVSFGSGLGAEDVGGMGKLQSHMQMQRKHNRMEEIAHRLCSLVRISGRATYLKVPFNTPPMAHPTAHMTPLRPSQKPLSQWP